jgi:hypothetical protein
VTDDDALSRARREAARAVGLGQAVAADHGRVLLDELDRLTGVAGAAGHGWTVAQRAADESVAAHRCEVDRLHEDLRRTAVQRETQRRVAADVKKELAEVRAERDALRDVARRLRDGWTPRQPLGGESGWRWHRRQFDAWTDRPDEYEPMPDALHAVLDRLDDEHPDSTEDT